MARVVLLLDSATGALIDVAGNSHEDGRYLKFVKRILSLDKNPILDYGSNGGDTLEISKGGNSGKAVNVKADVLNVSGEVKSGGKTIAEIAKEQVSEITSILRGKTGEIDVDEKVDEETGDAYVEISLDSSISTVLDQLDDQIAAMLEFKNGCVSKRALAEALEGIEIHEEDTLEDVKAQFSALLRNLNAIASESETEEVEESGGESYE